MTPNRPASGSDHSRFAQRIRRRYGAALNALPPGVPERAAQEQLFATLRAQGESVAAALRMILQTLVDRSLNDALPAIPIPSFVIPDSLRMYGLPAGRELGITAPALALEQGVFVLRGGFGVR